MITSFLFITIAAARKTILISSDGFRWDYYGGTIPTPGLDRIRSAGLQVKNLINSYATVTFPNHYTLATGLYEESHGIIDNEMYDPVFNELFNMSTTDPKWWSQAEPIWITAEKNNIKTVCVNWVGCSIPHGTDEIRPTYWNLYNGSITYEERIDRVVDKLFSGGADLGLLYFEDPDHTCHMFGPESNELRDAVERVDSAILYLLSKVHLDTVNIIFTSDHGGTAVSKERIVVLEDYTDSPFMLAASGAVAHVWPNDISESETILKHFSSIESEKANCFLREDLPRRLHYTKNRRIGPIVCMAELGWTILKSRYDGERFELKGSHGYDAGEDDSSPMRPVFLAAGPDFVKTGLDRVLEPFENIHVFPIVATLIGLSPESWPQINGSSDPIQILLSSSQKGSFSLEPWLLGLTFTVGMCFVLLKE